MKSKSINYFFYFSKNKLVSWLSTVAPAALNLKLRPEYYQLTI